MPKKRSKLLFEPSTAPIKIGAGWIVHHFRVTLEAEGEAAVIATARACGFAPEKLTDDQIIKIARKLATLRGYSDPGFTYHETWCKTCAGRGHMSKIVTEQCPDCKGDGFHPPAES